MFRQSVTESVLHKARVEIDVCMVKVSTMRVIIILCALAFASAQRNDEVEVITTEGKYVGKHVVDGDYAAFYGIAYGGSTSGENRFKAPTEVKPMTYHDYDALVASNKVICAQPTLNGIIGIEDCLVVDVFSKNVKTPKQPVFVWLESEDYERTSNISYPIENLVQQGLVVISVKYRLSIFGFLCLGVPEAPGNAGMKDVILALKWIQKNAAAFGGDPNNVILAGHGSGAAMVDMITLSPLSENLVHKAIVLSGSALAPWAVSHDPIGDAKRIAKKLKYTDKTPSELAQLFQETDFHVIGGAISATLKFLQNYNNPPLFAPCIENPKLKEGLLNDAPINILRSGKYISIPYVAGFTDLEGTIRDKLSRNNWHYDISNNFEKFLPADIKYQNNVSETTIRNFYFGDKPTYNISSFLQFQGDILVLGPINRGVMERAATSKSPVRIFEFAYPNGTESTFSEYDKSAPGVRHGELLNYIFNYNLKESSTRVHAGVQSRIVEFAKTGSFPFNSVEWKPVDKHSLHLLYLSGIKQGALYIYKEESPGNVNEIRTNFWNKIYETNYIPPKPIDTSSANSLVGFGLVIILAQIIIRFI